jgi:hypothetical protein
MNTAADIPTWLGILMFMVGLGLTVGMAKWVARRERTRNGNTARN